MRSAVKPFNINERPDPSKPGAKLPTLGTKIAGNNGLPTGVIDVDSYLAALHTSIGDSARLVKNNFMEAVKALGGDPVPQAYSYASFSFMPDPTNYGLVSWPGLQPEALRKISRENIAPQMIIRSRVTDLRRYSGLSSHPWKPGWHIVLMDAEKTPTAQDRKDIKDAERFIWNCSRDIGYMDARERDAGLIHPFEMFLCTFVDDALTFDGWALWTDMDSSGGVRSFVNLPAGSIRLAVPTRGYKGNREHFACLVDETGNPVKPFTRKELTWRVRNARNDPAVMGYGWSEIEMAIRLIQGFQSAIDLNVSTFDQNCYSADTEVMTKSGWKTFDAVSVELDEFATLNLATGNMEYQKATGQTWGDYDGDMYWLKSRSVDLYVTPEHRIITQYVPGCATNGDFSYTVTKASDLYEKYQGMSVRSRENYALPTVSKWVGRPIPDQDFACNPAHYAVTSKRVSGDDYCAFMGMYLAEGNLAPRVADEPGTKHRIDIHQYPTSKAFAIFRDLIKRLTGKEPLCDRNRMSIGWYGLAQHLSQFGTNCYNKRIPQIILDAPPRQQQIFWDYYLLGDGSVTWQQTENSSVPHSTQHIATTSRVMADQLQELLQKMGYSGRIGTITPSADCGEIKGAAVKTRATRYDVYLKKSKMNSMNMEKGYYRGKVGCVSVPNGTLYVRRNGKAAWCGNSIPNGMLLLRGDYFQEDQIDALVREWTNMKRGVSKLWGMPVMSIPADGEVEVLRFQDLKGDDVRYRDHMNMMAGLCCVVYNFPIRRLGMFTSGHHKDNAPLEDASVEVQGADDGGLPALLEHLEGGINPYLLWSNWPHLKFEFVNKDPKASAREYEARKTARTWGEARAEADLPKLEKLFGPELQDLAKLMDLCPEDPIKAAVYQTVATVMLQAELAPPETGEGGNKSTGGSTAKNGPRIMTSSDPAKKLAHGHMAGTKRDSRAEKDNATGKVH